MSQDPPSKAIADALLNNLKNDDLASVSGAANLMGDMQSILADALGNGMELPPEMADLMEQTNQMTELARQMAEMEAAGDIEGMTRLTAEFSKIAPGPDYTPDTYAPAIQAVFDAIDYCDVDALLAALPGVDLNEGHGQFNKTPLYDAVAGIDPSLAIINVLLDHGADPKLGLIGDSTPLHGAAFTHFRDFSVADLVAMIKRFQSLGADIEAPTTSYGWTPLHAALMETNEKLLEALLLCGADPHAPFGPQSMPCFTRGSLPVHQAMYQPALMRILLAHGADPAVCDSAGRTVAELIEGELHSSTYEDGKPSLRASLDIVQARSA